MLLWWNGWLWENVIADVISFLSCYDSLCINYYSAKIQRLTAQRIQYLPHYSYCHIPNYCRQYQLFTISHLPRKRTTLVQSIDANVTTSLQHCLHFVWLFFWFCFYLILYYCWQESYFMLNLSAHLNRFLMHTSAHIKISFTFGQVCSF